MRSAPKTAARRELSTSELDEVSGGFLAILGRLAVGVGMAILEGQQHNGTGSGKLGPGMHK